MTETRSDAGSGPRPALEQGVSHFNGRRYLHADGAWRRATLTMPEEDGPFLEGLRLVTWGLYYVDRKNYRSSRRELVAGLAQLVRFPPGHLGLVLDEVVDMGGRLLGQLEDGSSVYLIPPVIKLTQTQALESVADGPPRAGH